MHPLANFVDPAWVLAAWCREAPLCWVSLGDGKTSLLALTMERVEFAALADFQPGAAGNLDGRAGQFSGGFAGILGYGAWDRKASQIPGLIFRVKRGLLFDRHKQKIFVTGSGQSLRAEDEDLLERAAQIAIECRERAVAGVVLRELDSVDAYRRNVLAVQSDIRCGLYYQLNLLRYFAVDAPPTPLALAVRIARVGGGRSAWFRDGADEVVSFSPETFLQVRVDADGRALATTCPIKGTARRFADPESDLLSVHQLSASRKEQAELNMIIDLMRNDLNTVSVPGSVVVGSSGRILTTAHVHHRVAEISSKLRSGIHLADLVRAVLPAGSITGAPKRAVMSAIAQYESRERRFFMGCGFCADEASGRWDSMVAIRTLQRHDARWEYAAGSGITLLSDPQEETDEITAKCRVLTSGV